MFGWGVVICNLYFQGQPVLPASQGFTTASSAATSSSVVSPPLSSTQGFDPHADPLNENLRVT